MKRIVGVLLALVAVSCGGGEEGPTPVGQGSAIPVDRAHEFGLPEEFPLPEGATEANLVTSGTETINMRFIVDRSPEQMEAFYGTELRKNGWRVDSVDAAAELVITIGFEGNGWTGTVTIVKQTQPIQVVVTLRSGTLGPEPPADG